MFTSLSLRLRIFLLFAALALGALLVIGLALWQGYSKGDGASGYIQAGLISAFGILGLTAGLWLLFDENLAKPIERLASQLRARAHGGVDGGLDLDAARYLGDLAPAAQAVTKNLADGAMQTAQSVALATEKLASERERLTALLTEIPVAMIPNAKPVSAPTMSEGEKTPPPMRPPMVIATAKTLRQTKITASFIIKSPVNAAVVVSYPTPMI